MKNTTKVLFSGVVALSFVTSNIAWAGYVPSNQAIVSEHTQQQRSHILSLLDRTDVQTALQERGVSPDEAKKRVAMLSSSQVEQLKTQLDTLPAGEGAVGAVVGAILIVFFVLLFTDILGETDVYDFDD